MVLPGYLPNLQAANGLQSHTIARTAKLAKLPNVSPPTKQKLATVAATSTSSVRPLNRGLCATDGAAIMHILDTYPFDSPNNSRISINSTSEVIMGWIAAGEDQ